MTRKLHFANLFWNRLNQQEREMALKSVKLGTSLATRPLSDDYFNDKRGNIIEILVKEKVDDGEIKLQSLISILYFYGLKYNLFKKVKINIR